MATWRFAFFSALVVLAVTGCRSPQPSRPASERVLTVGGPDASLPLALDRGDWAVSRKTEVWKVMAEQPDRPPVHVGYLTGRQYRQMRGGPEYMVYAVTTLNRREEVGRIDQLGHSWRYEPRRNAGFEEVDLGVLSLENGVAEVLQLKQKASLVQTSERRIAFELLDQDGSGTLEAPEVATQGDRIRGADANRDGKIDFEEFDAIDVL